MTGYQTKHDNDLHLIVVRRDLVGFQHVHPTLAQDGTWSVPVDLSAVVVAVDGRAAGVIAMADPPRDTAEITEMQQLLQSL